jgi:hypothetical protein
MNEGLGIFFDEFGNPINSFFPSPLPGPDFPGGELPDPRTIPGAIIKDRITTELSDAFDKAGIDFINPSLVVNLADQVRQGNITANDALNAGFDLTVSGAVDTAANLATGGGLAASQFIFGKIKQAEQLLGRPLLPAEVNQLLGTVLNFPNVVSSGIIDLKDRLRSGFVDDDNIVIGGGDDDDPPVPTTVTGVSGPAGMVVDPGAVSSSFGGRGGADRGGDVVIGGSTPGTVVIGGTTGTTPGPAGMGFTPPAPKKDRFPMGRAEGGLATIPKYLKGR